MTDIIVALIIWSGMIGIVAFIDKRCKLLDETVSHSRDMILNIMWKDCQHAITELNKKMDENKKTNEESTPVDQTLEAQLEFYKKREQELIATIRSMVQMLSIHEIHIIRDEDKED